MSFAPKITRYFDNKPCPRAEVLFETFALGTARVTVYRSAGGRDYPMRGAINAAVAGALTRVDFEIPFGVDVTYRAEMFSSSGMSLGFTSSATTILHFDGTVVHNPLDPQGAVYVDLLDQSAAIISRPVNGEILHPQGRVVGVAITSGRRGLSQVNLVISTRGLEDADKFSRLVGGYSGNSVAVMCIRTGSPMRIPKPLFLSVLDPKERAVDVHLGGTLIDWDLDGTEVSPPAPGIFIPLLTRADINAFYPTRAAVNAAHPTRLSVNRAYDLIGAAS